MTQGRGPQEAKPRGRTPGLLVGDRAEGSPRPTPAPGQLPLSLWAWSTASSGLGTAGPCRLLPDRSRSGTPPHPDPCPFSTSLHRVAAGCPVVTSCVESSPRRARVLLRAVSADSPLAAVITVSPS